MQKQSKALRTFYWIVGLIVALGIGGLFINGTFETTFLGFLPKWIHMLVGWTVIITTGIGAILDLLK